MEKFCEFITDPDWWGMIATFFAAIVAAVITWIFGKRQETLQKKLLQLEKFNVQREIYRNLYLLSLDSKVVLPLVYEYLAIGSTDLLLSRFDKYSAHFDKLARKIEFNEADYLLQFEDNDMIVDARCLADSVLFIFNKVASIKLPPRKDILSFMEKMQARQSNWSDTEWLGNIKKKCTDEHLIAMLELFVKEKHRLFEGENSVLMDVQNKYKSNG